MKRTSKGDEKEKGKEKEKEKVEEELEFTRSLSEELKRIRSHWEASGRTTVSGSGEESEEFQMYAELFSGLDPSARKRPSFPDTAFKFLEENRLRQRFPHRFSLDLAKKIFESFLAEWPKPQTLQDFTVYFKHDQITYRGEIRHKSSSYLGRTFMDTIITLPNNGFFYPHPKTLDVQNISPKERHQTSGWLQLEKKEINIFDSLTNFCHEKFGVKPQCRIYYNYDFNMLDFQAINPKNKDKISICFHYGVPESDFEDKWIDMD